MKSLADLARAASQILGKYVAVHNDIFAPSLWRNFRRVVPIPGIFEAIPYANHSATPNGLRKELAQLQLDAGSALQAIPTGSSSAVFLKDFAGYAEVLAHTISKLEEISGEMPDRANGKPTATLADYERDCREYERIRALYA